MEISLAFARELLTCAALDLSPGFAFECLMVLENDVKEEEGLHMVLSGVDALQRRKKYKTLKDSRFCCIVARLVCFIPWYLWPINKYCTNVLERTETARGVGDVSVQREVQ